MNYIKISLLFSLLLFTVSSIQGQELIQDHIRWVTLDTDYKPLKLHFYDGTQVSGNGIVKNGINEILIRNKVRNKVETYSFFEIKKLDVFYGEKVISFIFVVPDSYNHPLLLQQIREGKVNLYMRERNSIGNEIIDRPRAPKYYFLERHSEGRGNPVIPYTHLSRKFKKSAKAYFQDCPSLVEKIQSKEYKREDVIEMVDFYNSECQ